MPPFSYAAFVAHRKAPADYSVFAGQLFAGRAYRQPLRFVPFPPVPNEFAPGLEIYLHATAAHPEIPTLYAWTDGALTWKPDASLTRVGQLTLVASTTSSALLNTFGQIERAPRRGVYDNVGTDSVLDVFGDFLRARYDETAPGPVGKPKKDWHPTLTETQVEINRGGKVTRQSLKEYLDTQYAVYLPPLPPGDPTRDPLEPVRKLMRRFTAEPFPDGPVIGTLLVKAGDPIGAAAAPPLPPGPGLDPSSFPDWLTTDEARQVTLEIYDPSDQPLNPLYSFYQLFGEPSARATSVTDGFETNGDHPIVQLYSSVLNAATPPRARAQIEGVSILPIGELSRDHGFPPSSTYVWHYADSGALVATPMPETAVPSPRTPNLERDAIEQFWERAYNNPRAPAVTTMGQAIGIIADAFQVPCEIIVAIAGAESSFVDRIMRLEPLSDAFIAQNPTVGALYQQLAGRTGLVAGNTAPSQLVHAGNALTWGQLNDVITRTGGQRFSPGIVQTLLGTARGAVDWARTHLGGTRFDRLLQDLGLDAVPTDLLGYIEWLFDAPQSLLAGTAYIRKRYNEQTTRFDLPLVAGVYNHSTLDHTEVHGAWGVIATTGYIDHVTKFYNAAIRFFNGNIVATPPVPPAVPTPIVRLGR